MTDDSEKVLAEVRWWLDRIDEWKNAGNSGLPPGLPDYFFKDGYIALMTEDEPFSTKLH